MVLLTLIILKTTAYVLSEQNVYCWDYRGYWGTWEEFGYIFSKNPLTAVHSLLHSIRNEQHNSLPVALTFWFQYFGLPSRLSYILSLVILYFFPLILLFHYLCKQFTSDWSVVWIAITCILPATFVAFWGPTLRGYPDISGLLGIVGSILLVSREKNLSVRIQWKEACSIGVLLWSPFLLREWYAYSVISLYVSLPFLNYFIYNDKLSFNKIKFIILNFFISGVFTVALAIIIQKNFIWEILHTDYSYIYSAYQRSRYFSFQHVGRIIGLYNAPFVLIGCLWSIIGKKEKWKLLIIFSSFNLIFTFFIFTQTQSPSTQHCLPFALWVLIISTISIGQIIKQVNIKFLQYGILICLVFSSLYIYRSCLFENNQIHILSKWLPEKTFPLKVDHYENYLKLVQDIETLKDSDRNITVLSSRSLLNDDLLVTISNQKLAKKIVYTSQVDLRDGFKVGSLMSTYFVVADPIQFHLSPTDQRVISIPAKQILSNTGIGKHFKKILGPYILDGDIKVFVFQKITPFAQDEIKNLLSEYLESYPHWKNELENPMSLSMLSTDIHKGDIWGTFSLESDNSISAHPGENIPTIVNWVLKGVQAIKFYSDSTQCENPGMTKIDIKDDHNHQDSFILTNGASRTLNVNPYLNEPSTLTISKYKSSACDHINISFK